MKENYKDILERTELIIDATSTLARENNPEKNEKLLKEILYYKEIVKNVIMKKFPAKPNSNIKKYTDKLNILIEYDALYKTEFDVSEGMNINKYLYKLDNPDTLEDYNKNLLKIIDIFLNRNITLNGNTFNFNRHTRKYMNSFLKETKNNDIIEFNKNMKSVFDGIYWENNDLLKDISQNIKRIILLNSDVIKDNSYKKRVNLINKFAIDEMGYQHEMASTKLAIENMIAVDPFYIVKKFLLLKLNLNDFSLDEKIIKEKLSEIINIDRYNELSEENKDILFENICLLSNDIYEYQMLQKFDFLLKEIIDNYKNYKMKYEDELIEYKEDHIAHMKVEEELFKLYAEHKKTIAKKITPLFGERAKVNKLSNLDKKIKKLNNESSEIVAHLRTSEKELSKSKFEQYVKNNITEDSSIYDIFNVYQTSYYELASFINAHETLNIVDLQNKIEEFKEFVNGPYALNIKNIRYTEYEKLGEIIKEKYARSNIKVDPKRFDNQEFVNNINLLAFYRHIKKANLRSEEIIYYIDYLKKIK